MPVASTWVAVGPGETVTAPLPTVAVRPEGSSVLGSSMPMSLRNRVGQDHVVEAVEAIRLGNDNMLAGEEVDDVQLEPRRARQPAAESDPCAPPAGGRSPRRRALVHAAGAAPAAWPARRRPARPAGRSPSRGSPGSRAPPSSRCRSPGRRPRRSSPARRRRATAVSASAANAASGARSRARGRPARRRMLPRPAPRRVGRAVLTEAGWAGDVVFRFRATIASRRRAGNPSGRRAPRL